MRRRGQRNRSERGKQLPGGRANAAAESGRTQQVVWLREHNSAADGPAGSYCKFWDTAFAPIGADRLRTAPTSRAYFLHRILRGNSNKIRAQGRAITEDSSMFTLRVPDPFGCRGVSCVKLPAAVAFPIDSQLLDRLEQSRRALPPNSVKPLLRSLEPQQAEPRSAQRPRDAALRSTRKSDGAHATIERFPARVESRLRQLVRIEPLYARNKVALGQH